MKKPAAIFLVLVFMFNLAGYRLWFYFEQQRSDAHVAATLANEEYNESDLITITVSLSLPYQNDSKEFERITGEVNFNGKVYKYVKRKIENGQFVLLCLPDKNKMQIEKTKDDFFKHINDLTQNNSGKTGNSKPNFFKNATSEYDEYSYSFKLNYYPVISTVPGYRKVDHLVSSPHISPEQPPDTMTG